MSLLNLAIVDSEQEIFSGDVCYLIAPAVDGEIGIYPQHMPILSKLKPGVLRLTLPAGKEQLIFAISGGFLEVKDNKAVILADIVERTDELDEARLHQEYDNALIHYQNHKESSSNAIIATAQVALESAIAQLKALDYIKRHSKMS